MCLLGRSLSKYSFVSALLAYYSMSIAGTSQTRTGFHAAQAMRWMGEIPACPEVGMLVHESSECPAIAMVVLDEWSQRTDCLPFDRLQSAECSERDGVWSEGRGV